MLASRARSSRPGLLAAVLPLLLLLATGCAPREPNVLVVTIDTLRADRLGAYGFSSARTPNIDRLATEGVLVQDAATVAPITLPSHTSIFTGLLPPAHGVRDNGAYQVPDSAVTLAERLSDTGYRTQAIVSALVLNRRYNLSQGFGGYDDDLWAEDQAPLFMIRDRPAARTAERAVAWLDDHRRRHDRQPFFLWVHFFDPHQPYEASWSDRLGAASPYDAEVTAADRGVGQILDALRRDGRLDDTIVVLTADHGESLGEHGEKTHAVFIYDATMHVPLIWRYPRLLPRGARFEAPVSTIDIVPTLLGLLGSPGGAETQGRDLSAALRGQAQAGQAPQYLESLLSEVGFGMAPLYGVRHEGFKWIRAPRPELYDLRRDPRELDNRYPLERARADKLELVLRGLIEDSEERALPVQANPMDRETLETLRALGYLAAAEERKAMAGLDPKDGIVLYSKLEDARHLGQAERWAEAEVLLREVLAVTPANVSARNILATARLRQGDRPGARDEYLRSLAEEPGQARVYAMLGSLDLLDGELDSAERNYRKSLEISPSFVEAMANLGLLASLRGDETGALAWYERSLAADPSFPRAHRLLADHRYERGEYREALTSYQKVLAVQPHDFDALLQAGNSARRLGEVAQARSYFEDAADARPDSWMPSYNLACLAAVHADPETSLRELERALASGFDRPAFLEKDEDLASLRGRQEWPTLLARAREAARARGSSDDLED